MKIATYNVNGVDGLPARAAELARGRSRTSPACRGSKHRTFVAPSPLWLACRRPRRENGLLLDADAA